ncbi:cellulase family glycosylhydrolase [Gammaproteobacteria bacterium]|nr:cellulase family glycosylhydrolase [Gammaproteobacteria bacterium]
MESRSADKFGEIDLRDWFEFDDPYNLPIDLGHLNHLPAGKHGFLQARGGELVFADGTKVKFWGTNISANALFKTSYINIPKQARRIAALGFNLARIHHHDSVWVNPNVFGYNARSTLQIDDQYMKYLDKWIAELNKQGVYVWFDLHVERFVTREDNIFAFNEIDRKTPRYEGRANINGYAYVNRTIQNSMKEINRQFLSRINQFTKQKYADNPGIAFLLLTNENDVTNHYGNKLLPPRNVPRHTEIYLSEARAFADRWDLPKDKVWQSWNSGASKFFLNDLEHRFNQDLIASLREYDGNHLISTTSTWGMNPLSSLPSLTDGDVIDVHSYGKPGPLEGDPRIVPNLMHWIAAAQIADKPISVSEWNVSEFPVPDRHLTPFLIAGMASHQGWDAIMQFGYSAESPVKGGRAFNFAMYNDPGLLGTMPAAAIMFRLGHIQEAKRTYLLAPDKNALMYETLSPATSTAIRTIPEVSKLMIALPELAELPWMKATEKPDNVVVIRDPAFSAITDQATSATSDTGELTRNWEQGTYTIDTDQSKSVSGRIGGKIFRLNGVEFAIETRNASIAVQSLDALPISASKDILISMGARSIPEKRGRAPILAEPINGKVKIYGLTGLRLFRKTSTPEFTEVPMSYDDGAYTINLTSKLATYWLFLRESKPTRFQ